MTSQPAVRRPAASHLLVPVRDGAGVPLAVAAVGALGALPQLLWVLVHHLSGSTRQQQMQQGMSCTGAWRWAAAARAGGSGAAAVVAAEQLELQPAARLQMEAAGCARACERPLALGAPTHIAICIFACQIHDCRRHSASYCVLAINSAIWFDQGRRSAVCCTVAAFTSAAAAAGAGRPEGGCLGLNGSFGLQPEAWVLLQTCCGHGLRPQAATHDWCVTAL